MKIRALVAISAATIVVLAGSYYVPNETGYSGHPVPTTTPTGDREANFRPNVAVQLVCRDGSVDLKWWMITADDKAPSGDPTLAFDHTSPQRLGGVCSTMILPKQKTTAYGIFNAARGAAEWSVFVKSGYDYPAIFAITPGNIGMVLIQSPLFPDGPLLGLQWRHACSSCNTWTMGTSVYSTTF